MLETKFGKAKDLDIMDGYEDVEKEEFLKGAL